MRTILPAALLFFLAIFFSGCIFMSEPLKAGVVPNNQRGPGSPQAGEYANAASGGVFNEGDKVEFLGVKGTIISGRLENNKVIGGPPFQINNETGQALIYASTTSQYGFAELFHYPQRGTGEGEADLYINGELIITVKFTSQASFNAYTMIACEPDKYPDYSQSVLERHKNCS